jgi:hypothetical protein
MGQLFCRRLNGVASPGEQQDRSGSDRVETLNRSGETPRAEPHAGCCGGWGRKSPSYPIRPRLTHNLALLQSLNRDSTTLNRLNLKFKPI